MTIIGTCSLLEQDTQHPQLKGGRSVLTLFVGVLVRSWLTPMQSSMAEEESLWCGRQEGTVLRAE